MNLQLCLSCLALGNPARIWRSHVRQIGLGSMNTVLDGRQRNAASTTKSREIRRENLRGRELNHTDNTCRPSNRFMQQLKPLPSDDVR